MGAAALETSQKIWNKLICRNDLIFVLSFKNENGRTTHTGYYLQKVEIKDFNVNIVGKNVFDQPVNDDNKSYENIRKIATDQGDDYRTGCLLDYP